MKRKREYRDFIMDIMNAIENIENFTKGMDFEAFVNDKEKLYATIHCIEIIGEAVKNLPDEIKKKYPDVPWRKIAAMRNRLIHGYFVVDYRKVWKTISEDLFQLKKDIRRISRLLGSAYWND